MTARHCEHDWIGSTTLSVPLEKWRSCRHCGMVEKAVMYDRFSAFHPAPIMAWTTEMPTKPGWYWYRWDLNDNTPVVVEVHPEHDSVGPWGDGSDSRLSDTSGEWAGPLKPPK